MMELIQRKDYETYYEYLQAIKESRNDGPHEQSDSMYRQEDDDGPALCSTKWCENQASSGYKDPNGCERLLCIVCKNAFNMGMYHGNKGDAIEVYELKEDE